MREGLALVAALALAGCVATNVSAIDSRTAIISGRGTAFDNAASVQTTMLRKAAELTLSRGFTHFIVVGAQDRSSSSIYRAPTTTSTAGTLNSSCMGAYCSGSLNATSQTTGGSLYNIAKPGADMMVRFLTAAEASGTNAWSAQEIMAAMATEGQ